MTLKVRQLEEELLSLKKTHQEQVDVLTNQHVRLQKDIAAKEGDVQRLQERVELLEPLKELVEEEKQNRIKVRIILKLW